MSDALVYSGSALSGIDDKGRLAIPAELRALVDASSGGRYLCLTKHEDFPCLIGFGRSRVEDMKAEIDSEEQVALSRGAEYNRDKAGRKKFALMKEISFDASGRFVLPPLLRSVASLDDNAYFYGNGAYFCIWSPSLLLEQDDDDFAAEKMAVEFFLEEAGKKK